MRLRARAGRKGKGDRTTLQRFLRRKRNPLSMVFASKVRFSRDWPMDEKIVQEMLHELFSSLEALDTQNAAILQFLKDKGIASEQELAPYLEQAGNASSVRWLAASVRMNHLLSSAIKTD